MNTQTAVRVPLQFGLETNWAECCPSFGREMGQGQRWGALCGWNRNSTDYHSGLPVSDPLAGAFGQRRRVPLEEDERTRRGIKGYAAQLEINTACGV